MKAVAVSIAMMPLDLEQTFGNARDACSGNPPLHSTGVASYEAGIELVGEIARRRARRGYASVPLP